MTRQKTTDPPPSEVIARFPPNCRGTACRTRNPCNMRDRRKGGPVYGTPPVGTAQAVRRDGCGHLERTADKARAGLTCSNPSTIFLSTLLQGLLNRVGGTQRSGIPALPFKYPFNLAALASLTSYGGSFSERRFSQLPQPHPTVRRARSAWK